MRWELLSFKSSIGLVKDNTRNEGMNVWWTSTLLKNIKQHLTITANHMNVEVQNQFPLNVAPDTIQYGGETNTREQWKTSRVRAVEAHQHLLLYVQPVISTKKLDWNLSENNWKVCHWHRGQSQTVHSSESPSEFPPFSPCPGPRPSPPFLSVLTLQSSQSHSPVFAPHIQYSDWSKPPLLGCGFCCLWWHFSCHWGGSRGLRFKRLTERAYWRKVMDISVCPVVLLVKLATLWLGSVM